MHVDLSYGRTSPTLTSVEVATVACKSDKMMRLSVYARHAEHRSGPVVRAPIPDSSLSIELLCSKDAVIVIFEHAFVQSDTALAWHSTTCPRDITWFLSSPWYVRHIPPADMMLPIALNRRVKNRSPDTEMISNGFLVAVLTIGLLQLG